MSTAPDVLTASQAARRQRVIQAALELGAEGGYDAVQMRDVAVTANVALATIYRYFSSKDDLLAAAMTEWTGRLKSRVAQSPPRGRTAAERAARESYGRLVAYLSARTRDLAGAEDALAEAFTAALDAWPRDGVPTNPDAWLLTVARRRQTDALRRRCLPGPVGPQLRLLALLGSRQLRPPLGLCLLFQPHLLLHESQRQAQMV